uniref:Cysteine-rich transmembrane domain-containing protein n=4 Tax=Triticinae TaxID=1648030 RepID=A0A453M4G5_AEGTS
PRCKAKQSNPVRVRFGGLLLRAFPDASPHRRSIVSLRPTRMAYPPLPRARHVQPRETHTAASPAGYKYTRPPPRNAISHPLHLPAPLLPVHHLPAASFPIRPRRHCRLVQSSEFVVSGEIRMSDPKYAYPYPAQGYYQGGPYQGQGGPYQGPPVMAPPQYAAPPPRAQPSFLEGCLAALCCCCLIDECCCDPSIIFVG